ncbi:hypothetical protein DEVEQU_00098 [Devosia equisanguinis]|uniref:Uncharacterized protein n=1 Tax=Devosia equisanguinis TaxID=2490941 RepID=A0A3S4GH22_9HYPH|nr:hypothetical protein DEVEQU_00098 [Devosia equisanguinis]
MPSVDIPPDELCILRKRAEETRVVSPSRTASDSDQVASCSAEPTTCRLAHGFRPWRTTSRLTDRRRRTFVLASAVVQSGWRLDGGRCIHQHVGTPRPSEQDRAHAACKPDFDQGPPAVAAGPNGTISTFWVLSQVLDFAEPPRPQIFSRLKIKEVKFVSSRSRTLLNEYKKALKSWVMAFTGFSGEDESKLRVA